MLTPPPVVEGTEPARFMPSVTTSDGANFHAPDAIKPNDVKDAGYPNVRLHGFRLGPRPVSSLNQ